MARCFTSFLFLVVVTGATFCGCAGGTSGPTIQAGTASLDDGIVCFVVRTYWGHGDTWGDKSLRRILGSLQNQTVGRWEALLIVMDNRPFPELRRIVREINDSRIWVQAEWINFKYNPKDGGLWVPGYHNKLYNLTDTAIRACPTRSRWVVVTNGDNNYDPKFVETVFTAPSDVDAVSVDFYSRYQRPTALPCERFEEGEGMPPCKANEMRFCQTDLAANAYRLDRFLAEDRRFGLVDPGGSHGANDGIMAQALRAAGWKVHYVHGRCLVNHAPSPQQCAVTGGVWDDTIMYEASSFGGTCVSVKSVLERVRTHPAAYELLELNVTFDRDSFSYSQYPFIELKCLRRSNSSTWTRMETYGRVCAARVDLADLPSNSPPHPWDSTPGIPGAQNQEEEEQDEWGADGYPSSDGGGVGEEGEEVHWEVDPETNKQGASSQKGPEREEL